MAMISLASSDLRRNAISVIDVRGELDASTNAIVTVMVAVALRRRCDIVLDVSDIAALDATFLRTILFAAQRASKVGRRLVIVAEPQTPLSQIAAFTEVPPPLVIASTVEDALQRLEQRGR